MASAADDEIFLDSKHAKSHRFAILEEKNGTAWLYLTAADKPKPEKDVVVFARSRLATLNDVRAVAKKGQPPPLAKDYASKDALIRKPQGDEFTFLWSKDGQSVAVIHRGLPIAMILSNSKRGFAKAISKSGPFGEPWDQSAYERAFGGAGGDDG